jgi:FtsZ-binding cell division protein ZapB
MREPGRHWSWLAVGWLGACAHQDPVTDYLSWQRRLVDANATQWTQMYESLPASTGRSLDQQNRIKLALLLGAHGRPPADLKRAEAILNDELSGGADLSPATRDLLVVTRDDLERRLSEATDRGTIRLRVQELKNERDALKREGRVLTEELHDIQTKLRALTQIERALEDEHTDRGEQR